MVEPARLPSTVETLLSAWSDYCARLDRLGRELVEDYAPADGRDAAETLQHLTQLLRTSLAWQVDSQDPRRPRLVWYDRSCDGVAPYGPNIDNSYLLVRVHDAETYRLQLDIRTIGEVNISVHTGSPYDGNFKTYGDLCLGDLDQAGGEAQIVFSRTPHQGAWFELPEGADYVFIRFYYFDWHEQRPPAVEFECLTRPDHPAERLDPRTFAERLGESVRRLSGAMHFGHGFGEKFLAGLEPNVAGPMRGVPGGGANIRYGGTRFALDPDQALLIEFEKPEARYWSVQWQRLPWGEPIDFMHHQTSLNHEQAEVGEDRLVRVVLAHRDPGVRNWLDTGRQSEGFVMCRWIWPRTDPQPRTRLVPFEQVRTCLPASTRDFGAPERETEMRLRRRHLSLRY